MSSLLGMTIALVVSGVAASVRVYQRRRWTRQSGGPEVAAWGAARGFRLTDGLDLALVDSLQRVLDVAGCPGDTGTGLTIGPGGGDDFAPLTRPEVGSVLVGTDGALVFDAWVGRRGFVYGALPGRTEWISVEPGGAASGPGATTAVHEGLLVGLAQPSRIRCGLGWITVSAPGGLDVATATLLLERVAAVREAVAPHERL